MIKLKAEDGIISRTQKRYYAFIMRRDRVVFEDLKTRDLLHPGLSISKIIGYLVAGLVHSITIGLPLIGLWVILSRWGGVFSICYGLIFFGLAFAIRPRFAKSPEDGISREQYPTLYEFVDSISNELSAPPIDTIVIDGQNNASLGTYGWRQAKVLTIGYPLWQALDEQSRTALIGHELAHQINSDSTRNLFIGSALRTLIQWYHIFYPSAIIDRRSGFLSVPVNLLFWAFANCALAIYLGLLQILLYDSRRAEYLADYIGASLGGTEAMLNVLKWLEGSNPKVTLDTATSHPATAFRIEFLGSKPALVAKVVLQPDYSKRIDSELLSKKKAIEERARLIYRSGYY